MSRFLQMDNWYNLGQMQDSKVWYATSILFSRPSQTKQHRPENNGRRWRKTKPTVLLNFSVPVSNQETAKMNLAMMKLLSQAQCVWTDIASIFSAKAEISEKKSNDVLTTWT